MFDCCFGRARPHRPLPLGQVLICALLVCSLTSNQAVCAEDGTTEKTARDVIETVIRPFLNTHCVECHGAQRSNAGFRIDQLSGDFSATDVADQWKEVLDLINLGKMPPKDQARPTPKDFEPVVEWITARLRDAEFSARNTGGRIPMRRLNRFEYANTVRDLLHVDSKVLAPIVEELPGDGRAEGFDRLGIALFFDQTQIERSLRVAERIAARAIVVGEPLVNAQRSEAESNPRVKFRSKTKSRFADTLIDAGPPGFKIIDGGVRFVHGYGNHPKDNSWGKLGRADCNEVVERDGYYRIRIRAGGDPGSVGKPIQVRAVYGASTPVELETKITIDAPLDSPNVHEAVVFLRSGPDGLKRDVAFSFNDIPDLLITTPENNRLYREIRQAQSQLRDANTNGAPQSEIDAAANELSRIRAEAAEWKGPLRHYNPNRDHKNPPTIFVDWFEISGPVVREWPPQSHKTILFAGDTRDDSEYVREIFARFLPRAFRRPVTTAEIDGVVTLVEQARRDGAEFQDAVRLGLMRVLCSPGFLFIQEPTTEGKPRKLSDYELASRLSYFLWSSMPDEQLFGLAAEEKLCDPQTLMRQVDRMLDDPKAEALVKGFGGQWLHVREFGSIMPAAEYQNDYDRELEESSRQEAYAFFREVLTRNLPVTNFLDSDFVMVNERLAHHYGIEGVAGADIRRVAIEPRHHRGGVLGMAGLMTLLSDGTRTLPVRRAAWVKTQLFGTPPGNPPPNAGEIQPNAAGKNLTVRQRLDLHRNEPTCASCHAKLDPFGIALENYDAIGQWRTRANGEGIRPKHAPPIDVSSTFPDGDDYASLEEYKAGLLKRKDQFARNLATKFLTYALTRPVGYADHQTVNDITDSLRRDDYRIRTLIRSVVGSELFQSK